VIARRLARDGFAVAVNGPPGDERVAAVGAAIRDDGGAAEGFCADVTDEEQVAGLAAAIADWLARSRCWSSTPPARNPKPP
jgi:3-oxoacyl-[acyl-carrier protein] reductase